MYHLIGKVSPSNTILEVMWSENLRHAGPIKLTWLIPVFGVIFLKNTAKLSECRKYRYALWRTWDNSKPFVMFVGLNPSTADETNDDPTLTRCMNFAKSWGYGGVCMANLFAFRATDPSVMKASKDPVGPENNKWLRFLAKDAGIVVAAWGNDGAFLGRSKQVKEQIPGMHCLKLNKSGEPAHPLYQAAKLKAVPMGI